MTYSNIKQRNPWLDYLKAFAIYRIIVLHVFGLCAPHGSDTLVCTLASFMDLPLFLVISGFLVMDKQINKSFWIVLIKRFVIPYAVWLIVMTLFYQGFGHIMHDGIVSNLKVLLKNCGGIEFWFIKAYFVIYILWQLLQRFSYMWRGIIGTVLLVVVNLLVQSSKPLAELASFSLYSYTLFASGACVHKYINKINGYGIFLLAICFFLCLPFAVPGNDYFSCSFGHMLQYNDWHIFFIRFIAGVSVSVALISIGCKKCINTPPHCLIIQGIGKNTLQIYMLQALLVQGILPRVIQLNNDLLGILSAYGIAMIMTLFCHVIIQKTMKFKLCRTFLWGMK